MYSAMGLQEVLLRRWEPWRWGAQWLANASWQRPTERIIEADSLTTTREVAKELRVSHSLIFSHLKLIGKVKKLISGCLMSWSCIKKIVLKCHLLFFAKTMDHFLIRLWCVMKSGFNMTTSKTSSVVRPKEDPKHFQKPSLYQKKSWSATVWWSAACLIYYSFLKLGETISSEKYAWQISEMHWKQQCLQPILVNRMSPILHDNARPHVPQPMLQKLNELGYEVLHHLPYSPDLLPTDYHLFKHLENFLQGKCFQN